MIITLSTYQCNILHKKIPQQFITNWGDGGTVSVFYAIRLATPFRSSVFRCVYICRVFMSLCPVKLLILSSGTSFITRSVIKLCLNVREVMLKSFLSFNPDLLIYFLIISLKAVFERLSALLLVNTLPVLTFSVMA